MNLKYARALMYEDRGETEGALTLYREFLAELPSGYAPGLRSVVEGRVKRLEGSR